MGFCCFLGLVMLGILGKWTDNQSTKSLAGLIRVKFGAYVVFVPGTGRAGVVFSECVTEARC